jgi:hypothetical protein
MILDSGNRLLDRLEPYLGRFALPQILRWIAGFQALSWGLSLFSKEYLELIAFNRSAVLEGQIWRLFSWVLSPVIEGQSPIAIFIVLIALLFMFFISDSLESHWGSFRLNVYVVTTILLLASTGFLPMDPRLFGILNGTFYSVIFLAFAALFPNHIIHLMMVIPIKAKWLGWANALLLFSSVLTSQSIWVAFAVLTGMAPYLLAFIPSFIAGAKQNTEAAVRRHRFQQSSTTDSEAFHVCESCGATDVTHPERDFRVTADGRELCCVCRTEEAKQAKS